MTKGFYICTAGRAGSSILCNYLYQLGVGRPNAWLGFETADFPKEVKGVDCLKTYLKTKEVQGIIGVKISWNYLTDLEQKYFPDLKADEFLLDLLPDAKFIYLDRKDKLHQALSRVKHMKLGKSHVRSDAEKKTYRKLEGMLARKPTPRDEIVDRIYLNVREHLAWETFFERNNINPCRIIFENFIQDKKGTLERVCEFLDVERTVDIAETFYSTHSTINDKWHSEMSELYTRYFE